MTLREIQELNLDTIVPDAKDFERADGLRWRGRTFYGNRMPFRSEAAKMSKLIKCPKKLVRRAKAVVKTYGTMGYFATHTYGINYSDETKREHGVWYEFADALLNMGFTYLQVRRIGKYQED